MIEKLAAILLKNRYYSGNTFKLGDFKVMLYMVQTVKLHLNRYFVNNALEVHAYLYLVA